MSVKTKPRKRIDETLVKVVAHPLRVQALAILAERAASPKELAAELGAPVGNVSYHVRELEQLGLIELVDEKKRRGAIEHFFRAVHRPALDDREWEKLDSAERQSMSAWLLQLMLADAAQALGAGTFDARSDRHLSRTHVEVDEQGWQELVDLENETLRSILEVRAACVKRLAEDDETFTANVSMALFEMPPKRPPPGDPS